MPDIENPRGFDPELDIPPLPITVDKFQQTVTADVTWHTHPSASGKYSVTLTGGIPPETATDPLSKDLRAYILGQRVDALGNKIIVDSTYHNGLWVTLSFPALETPIQIYEHLSFGAFTYYAEAGGLENIQEL